ncbi:GNAT family N-acetyltransferase [Dysgonomonas sp. Marseille-P4677]|uniref:GNAT family N-acetyltransferase n=1 Tax=Dysgonomonas sp. Marseille-P4677 TaxID=2364790 RepID=UPI001911AF59|nr:GNAT family N-acetyltransferase [Dysgonomonas sp. Marseille-P4677]MBK5722494.1 GNAT family N-acetyltransferase [Dysgonomonas sp. Marseille-P4677]
MKVVEASIDEIFIIQSLSDRIWPPTFADILSEEQIGYMMDMMYSTTSLEQQIQELGHRYLLAKDGDEYLGYVSYELNYKESEITKIHKIYVLPSIQGKGIGRLFLDTVGDIAKANHNRKLSLNVNRFNKAVDFYKHIGFEIIGKEDIDIGNGFLMEDYILNKKL